MKRVVKTVLVVLGTLLVGAITMFTMLLLASPASAHGNYVATETFIQNEILTPHNSVMTGEQVMAMDNWYGIPAHITLAIWAAESSLGDPKEGGRLVSAYNIGCMRAFKDYQKTKWGMLASGTINVGGKTWLRFPSAWAGAMAWGRYMKLGVNGAYRPYFRSSNWTYGISSIYYGMEVSGFSTYLTNLRHLDATYINLAAKHGFNWGA